MSEEILFGIPNKKPKRHRATKTGLIDRRAALLEIVRNAHRFYCIKRRDLEELASYCAKLERRQ